MTRMARRRRYTNPLYQPASVLSGPSLANAARKVVDLQYRPQQQALDREAQTTTTQGTALIGRAGDYYRQLAQEAANHVALQAAIGQRLHAGLEGNQAMTDQALKAAGQAEDARVAADQSLRGRGLEGGGAAAVAAELAAQQARAAVAGKTVQDAAAAGTANYEHLADLSDRATAARGGEVTQELINRLAAKQADITGRRSTLDATRGDALAKETLGLRQSAFENLITAKSLGLKEADLAASSADKAAQRRTQLSIARINDLTRRENNAVAHGDRQAALDYRKQRDAEMRDLGVGPYKSPADPARKPMSAEARRLRTGIENAVLDIQNDPKLAAHRYQPGPRLVQILVKRGAPTVVAQAAVERARYGYIRPSTATALRSAGVRVPRSWLQGKMQTQQRPG